jgi:hypothetical protein
VNLAHLIFTCSMQPMVARWYRAAASIAVTVVVQGSQ